MIEFDPKIRISFEDFFNSPVIKSDSIKRNNFDIRKP